MLLWLTTIKKYVRYLARCRLFNTIFTFVKSNYRWLLPPPPFMFAVRRLCIQFYTQLLLRVKRLWVKADHLPLYGVEYKNEWRYTATPSVGLLAVYKLLDLITSHSVHQPYLQILKHPSKSFTLDSFSARLFT